ncbi:MAG: hypothetical protein LBR56_07370 [Sporomusaceae bacterium]|nr:hypothetical protein [Sporomusaceae bacterium]
MKTTVLNPEELCAMYCQYFNVETPEATTAAPGALSIDELRALEDFAYLREAHNIEDKIERFAYLLNNTEPGKRCRRAYEMIMNACDTKEQAVFAKNSGLMNTENYLNMLQGEAEREADVETAHLEGFSLDDYLQMAAAFGKKDNFTAEEKTVLEKSKTENTALVDLAAALRAAEEVAENRRRDVIEEGKSFYAEKIAEYAQAASAAPEGGMRYYFKLYEIMNGPLTRAEILEDQIREAENPDLPLNREIFAELAQEAVEQDQEIFRSYGAKYGEQSDEFFYHLGQYATAGGYISAERIERERREILAGRNLGSGQKQGAVV